MTFKQKLKEIADAADQEVDEMKSGDLRNKYARLVKFLNDKNIPQNADYFEPTA